MDQRIDSILGTNAVSRLRALIGDRSDAVVAVGTADGELLWASEVGSRWMFGRDLGDFQGTSRFDYVHPDDLAGYRQKHQRALQGETVTYSVRASTADGEWTEVSGTMWRAHADTEPVIVAVTVDATDTDGQEPDGSRAD